MHDLKDAANESPTDGLPSAPDGQPLGAAPARQESAKTDAQDTAPDAPTASADASAAARGEPDTLPLTFCRKCAVEVRPVGRGQCPRCGVFMRMNFFARRHPVNVLRVDELEAQFAADYKPSSTELRMECRQLASAYEQMEMMRTGTPEWQRLFNAAQTLTEKLRANAPEPEPPARLLAQVPMSALTRSQELLGRVAAGETLTEREAGQLDVLQAALRGEIALPPDPQVEIPEGARYEASTDTMILENAGPTREPEATAEPAPSAIATCEYCGNRPCVGPDHHAYPLLHGRDPVQVARRTAAATAVMLRMMPYGHWNL